MEYEIDYLVNERDHRLSIGLTGEKRFDDCFFILSRYTFNNRLSLSVYSFSEGAVMKLTTNLPQCSLTDPADAFVDENNCPGAKDFLVENGFAKDLDRERESGYCIYPLVRLNLEKIIPYMARSEQQAWRDYLDGKGVDRDAGRADQEE